MFTKSKVTFNHIIAIKNIIEFDKFDFVVNIGNDVTDEDMFYITNEVNANTIKVGNAPTIAKYKLNNDF